jgi:hypothetical protein
MSNLSNRQDILLKEYAIAVETCRNHDQLTRTGLSIFAAVQAAIIGFIGSQKGSMTIELQLLKALGLWLSFVVFLTTLRLHHRYKAYMERLKSIEHQLGIYLYQYGFDYFARPDIPGNWKDKKILRHIEGNKRLWATIPLLTFGLYLLLIIRDWLIVTKIV